MTGKELKKLLLKNGWKIVRINGSHHIFEKNDDTIVLPIHSNKDLKKRIRVSSTKTSRA